MVFDEMLMNYGYKLIYIISNKYTDSYMVDWNVIAALNVWLKYASGWKKILEIVNIRKPA